MEINWSEGHNNTTTRQMRLVHVLFGATLEIQVKSLEATCISWWFPSLPSSKRTSPQIAIHKKCAKSIPTSDSRAVLREFGSEVFADLIFVCCPCYPQIQRQIYGNLMGGSFSKSMGKPRKMRKYKRKRGLMEGTQHVQLTGGGRLWNWKPNTKMPNGRSAVTRKFKKL